MPRNEGTTAVQVAPDSGGNVAGNGEPPDQAHAEVADIERLARIAAEFGSASLSREIRRLAERIADGRFFVACVGQFKRGKSTLINALLDRPVLPTGIVPITTVPTVVRFGETLRARVQFTNGEWHWEPPEALAAFVSEEENPENRKHVVAVELFVPSPLLADGLCLVDTPGIGSVFSGNTAATLDFVPHIDAALIVLGVDPPLSGEELALVAAVAQQAPHVMIILSKADRFTERERTQAIAFAEHLLAQRLGRPVGPILQVSATERLDDGRATRDWELLVANLRSLAITSRQTLVHSAAVRGVRRLVAQVHVALDRQRRDLTRPIDESEQLLASLGQSVERAAHRALELGQQLAEEQARVGAMFQRRRETFVARAHTDATRELVDRLAATPGRFGPTRRTLALEIAREVGRSRVEPWLESERAAAEQAYAAVIARFSAMADDFLEQTRRAGIGLDSLPDHLTNVADVTVPSRYVFQELPPLVYGSVVQWLGDAMRPAGAERHLIERDASAYLRDLLDRNSTLIEHDLDVRVLESRRLLEAGIQSVLRDVYLGAQQSLERARTARIEGERAVAHALEALDRVRSDVDALGRRVGAIDDAR